MLFSIAFFVFTVGMSHPTPMRLVLPKVLIKPAEGASYKNTVDILDETTINDVKRYAMVDISPAENETINKK